jgi:putative AlgH/UPF0301 family transcriptional regulator
MLEAAAGCRLLLLLGACLARRLMRCCHRCRYACVPCTAPGHLRGHRDTQRTPGTSPHAALSRTMWPACSLQLSHAPSALPLTCRYGAPIADLQPGVLLVASRDLDNTMFRRSVILVYEHGLRGAKGVMLTQPRASTGGSGAAAGAGNAGWTAASAAVAAQRAGADPRLPPRYIQPVPPRESAGSQKCDVSVGEGSCREGGSGANSSGGARKPPPLPIPAGTRLSNATAAVAKPAAGTATAASHQRALPIVQHYVGGPVGRLASRRAPQESLLLHSVPGVPGARRMLPSRPSLAAASAAAGSPAVGPADILRQRQRAAAAAVPLELFLGGSLDEVLEIAQAFSSETGGASRRRGGGGDPATASAAAAAARGQVSGDLGHQVKILHGLCSWAPGQLEGELRSGAWGYAAAEASDVWGVRPERLWEAVLASDRLNWF